MIRYVNLNQRFFDACRRQGSFVLVQPLLNIFFFKWLYFQKLIYHRSLIFGSTVHVYIFPFPLLVKNHKIWQIFQVSHYIHVYSLKFYFVVLFHIQSSLVSKFNIYNSFGSSMYSDEIKFLFVITMSPRG